MPQIYHLSPWFVNKYLSQEDIYFYAADNSVKESLLLRFPVCPPAAIQIPQTLSVSKQEHPAGTEVEGSQENRQRFLIAAVLAL